MLIRPTYGQRLLLFGGPSGPWYGTPLANAYSSDMVANPNPYGSGWYILDSAQDGLDLVGSHTITLWYRNYSAVSTTRVINGKWQLQSGNQYSYSLVMYPSGGNVLLEYYLSEDILATKRHVIDHTLTYVPVLNHQYFVAIRYDFSAGVSGDRPTFFEGGINRGHGVSLVDDGIASLYNNTSSYKIGYVERATKLPFLGGLDAVCVWDRALSDDEIQTLSYGLQVQGAISGLVSSMNFDGSSQDSSAKANHMSATGSPVTNATPLFGVNTHSLSFTRASAQRASIDDSLQSGLDMQHAGSDGSFAFWFYLDTLPAAGEIYMFESKRGPGDGFWIGLLKDGSNYRLDIKIRQDATNRSEWGYTFPVAPGTGTWIHCVITFDASEPSATQVTYYIDGSNVGHGVLSIDNNISFWENNAFPFSVGNDASATNFGVNGDMDDVMVFDYKLNDAQVSALFNDKTIPTPRPFSWWKFNNSYGDNSAIKHNTLIPVNSPVFVTNVPYVTE